MRRGAVMIAVAGCTFNPGTPSGTTTDGRQRDGTGVDVRVGDGAPGSARRKPITIDGTKVSGTLASFPLTLDFSDSQLVGQAKNTLFFTDAGGTPLPYEIVRWVSVNGRLHAFVSVGLQQNVNTLIYLRYGDPVGVPAEDPASVFAGYSAVWHFDDPLTSNTIVDSTGLHPATAINLGTSHSVMAQLARGIDFDGNTTSMTFTNPLMANTAHTISAWVSQRTARNFDTIIAVGTPLQNQSRWLYAVYNTPGVGLGLYMNDWDAPGTNVQNAGWTLLDWVFEGGGTNKSVFYRDGSSIGTHTHNSGVNTTGTSGFVGYAPAGWGADNYLDGIIDELRISPIAKSPEWILTEFKNQSAPNGFSTVGADEPVP